MMFQADEAERQRVRDAIARLHKEVDQSSCSCATCRVSQGLRLVDGGIEEWLNRSEETVMDLAYLREVLAEARDLLDRWLTPEKDASGAVIYDETEALMKTIERALRRTEGGEG